ncbi:hypothetical protein L6164_026331 [Bauhinia variegata]|uniref:Uncharacterized protein n=1 Tax=Bauhinia variegata TaxID=167791 RepID=A0ACB9LPJ7_BAUVA|nr:hypothetical protein L6164_026331 [Bauhinia variegata]
MSMVLKGRPIPIAYDDLVQELQDQLPKRMSYKQTLMGKDSKEEGEENQGMAMAHGNNVVGVARALEFPNMAMQEGDGHSGGIRVMWNLKNANLDVKTIAPRPISSYQSSFVHHRSIQDNIIIDQEIFHSMKRMRSRRGFMTIKVDLEKALC